VNKFLYQGKEMIEDNNLNLYDFHARGYDPVIGRTWQQDPHAENYFDLSPYSWVANNPLNVIDPTGMDTVNINNLDMQTFNPDEDVVGLDEVVVSASASDKPADATREYVPIWLLNSGDKVMGHRDGVSGLEDLFGY
jgi:RHS repeat-associated protein